MLNTDVSLANIKEKPEESYSFPRNEATYDVVTSQGNIYRDLTFLGYSKGLTKSNYLFSNPNRGVISINPSYVIEMQEIN